MKELMGRIKEYDGGLELKFEVALSNLSDTRIPWDTEHVLDIEMEDREFIDDWIKVIDDPLLKNFDNV